MSTIRRASATLACATIALLAFGPAGAAPGDGDETVEAVWKAQRITFEYRGFNTIYTCRSLRDKLERILENVGARDGITLRSYSCSDLSGSARFQIDFESPVEATVENIEAITSYSAEQELIAHVNGQRLAAAEDVPRFPAVWKTVSFARSRTMKLSAGDCELVHQLRQQILPRMSIRVTTDRVQCSPAFGNIGPPRLTVSALVPAKVDQRVE